MNTGSTAKFLSAWSASTTATVRSLVDLQQGPDGAIYVMNYMNATGYSANVAADAGTGIARIELKTNSPAACKDPSFGVTGVAHQMQAARGSITWLTVGTNNFSVYVEGRHEIQITDAHGKVVSTMNGSGIRDYKMPENLRSGIYYLRVKTTEGLAVRGFTRI